MFKKDWNREDYLKELEENQQPESDAWKEVVTETAGFEPLEVKFKRMEQAGIRAQFNSNEFTSSDLRNIYLNPDFQITPEDELEDIEIKQSAFRDYVSAYVKAKDKQKQGADDSIDDLIKADSDYSEAIKATAAKKAQLKQQREAEAQEDEKD